MRLVWLLLMGSMVASGLEAGELECRLMLLDGEEISGPFSKLDGREIRLEGRKAPIAYHELREIRFLESAGKASAGSARIDPLARAFVQFSSTEVLPGRLISIDDKAGRILVRGAKTTAAPAGETIGEISVPLKAIRAFRLREAHKSDRIFEESLVGTPPKSDLIFVRRGDRLIKIAGVFRGLDEDNLVVEYAGEEKRIKRTRIMGVIFAPIAGRDIDKGNEGSLWLRGGGQVPVVLRGITYSTPGKRPILEVSIRGLPWKVDLRHVDHIGFASDRIRFLSDLKPARVVEVPLFDNLFPHRLDKSVSGGALLLRGVEYRKGLGVHSRCILEYELDDAYASFVARVGIDDAVGARGQATVRVLGNRRTLFEGHVAGGQKPLEIVVSLLGIETLILETDFGKDESDGGDHVDWAEARIVKPNKK